MNILMVGLYDNTGMGFKLASAVNKYTKHNAAHAYFRGSYLTYPGGHFQPSKTELDELVAWADVVNGHDHWEPSMYGRHPDKPIVTTHHGSVYRARPMWFDMIAEDRGYVSTAVTLDLTVFGKSQWLPAPMPRTMDGRQAPKYDGGILRIAHAPTNRAGKNTAEIIAACDEVTGVELDIIEGVSNAECLDRKANAHVYVDQFQMGPGVNALESALMGQAVICGAQPWVHNIYEHTVGYWPFVYSALDLLTMTIKRMMGSPEQVETAAQVGKRFVLKYHDEAKIARRFITYCRLARKWGAWDASPKTFVGSYNSVAGISD